MSKLSGEGTIVYSFPCCIYWDGVRFNRWDYLRRSNILLFPAHSFIHIDAIAYYNIIIALNILCMDEEGETAQGGYRLELSHHKWSTIRSCIENSKWRERQNSYWSRFQKKFCCFTVLAWWRLLASTVLSILMTFAKKTKLTKESKSKSKITNNKKRNRR